MAFFLSFRANKNLLTNDACLHVDVRSAFLPQNATTFEEDRVGLSGVKHFLISFAFLCLYLFKLQSGFPREKKRQQQQKKLDHDFCVGS